MRAVSIEVENTRSKQLTIIIDQCNLVVTHQPKKNPSASCCSHIRLSAYPESNSLGEVGKGIGCGTEGIHPAKESAMIWYGGSKSDVSYFITCTDGIER